MDGFIPLLENRFTFIPHMHTDQQHRMYVGPNLMIDSVEEAQWLPFRWKETNRKATAGEIKAEWNAIRLHSMNEWKVDQPKQSQLYLPRPDILRAILNKLMAMEHQLLKNFPEFKRWPAEAQMAVLLMVWEGQDLSQYETELKAMDFKAMSELVGKEFTTEAPLIFHPLFKTAAKKIVSQVGYSTMTRKI